MNDSDFVSSDDQLKQIAEDVLKYMVYQLV